MPPMRTETVTTAYSQTANITYLICKVAGSKAYTILFVTWAHHEEENIIRQFPFPTQAHLCSKHGSTIQLSSALWKMKLNSPPQTATIHSPAYSNIACFATDSPMPTAHIIKE